MESQGIDILFPCSVRGLLCRRVRTVAAGEVVARLCLRVATHRRSIDTAECKFDSTPGLAPSDALRRKWAADAEATVGVSAGDVVEALTTPPLPK